MVTSDYEVIEEIGRGNFGVVYKCKSRANGEIFAVKSIDKTRVINDPIDKISLTNEPKALSLLSLSSTSSLFITRLHGAYDTPTHLHLVLDFCPSPTLNDVLKRQDRVPEQDAKIIFTSLVHGILHCHQNGVVHRDIKPDNVFIDPVTQRVKLCDFGSAGFLNDEAMMTEIMGTPCYVAPEVLRGVGYAEKVDVWSAGVILYVMLAGFLPFDGESVEKIFEKVLRGNLRFPSRVFADVSSSVKDLLRKMLCKEVSRRLSVQEVLRHPWMTSGELPQQ